MTPWKRKEVITDEELTMNTRNNTDAQQGEAHRLADELERIMSTSLPTINNGILRRVMDALRSAPPFPDLNTDDSLGNPLGWVYTLSLPQSQGGEVHKFTYGFVTAYSYLRIEADGYKRVQKIEHLTNLLRDEWKLHNRLDSPWNCVNEDCPYLGKPIPRAGCKCFTEAKMEHAAKVQEALK